MNIFFILWCISMIWLDFFLLLRGILIFQMHFLNLKGTFQPQPSPLFQKTGTPPPAQFPSLYPKLFSSSLFTGEKICILQFFVESRSFGIWNLIKHASMWGQEDEGMGGGGGLLGLKSLLLLILHTFDQKKVIHLPCRWCDVAALSLLANEKSLSANYYFFTTHILLIFWIFLFFFNSIIRSNHSGSIWKKTTDGGRHVCLCYLSLPGRYCQVLLRG